MAESIETMCRMALMQECHAAREAKKALRRFLRETRWVPYRAVDCDQDAVDACLADLRRWLAGRPGGRGARG